MRAAGASGKGGDDDDDDEDDEDERYNGGSQLPHKPPHVGGSGPMSGSAVAAAAMCMQQMGTQVHGMGGYQLMAAMPPQTMDPQALIAPQPPPGASQVSPGACGPSAWPAPNPQAQPPR